MAAPKPPQYCLHKATGQAYVRIRRKPFYLGKHGSEESYTNYTRILADLAAGREIRKPQLAQTPQAAYSVTVGELAQRYKSHAKSYYRKGDAATSEVHIVNRAMEFLAAKHDKLPSVEFSIGDLKAIRDSIVASGVSRGVANKYVDRIRRAFRWGATEELTPPSVAQALGLLSGQRKGRTEARESEPVAPVSDADVDATLSELSPTVAAMVKLQRLTGMRPGEVCQVRPCDVDRSGEVWVYVPGEHKTEHHGKQRVILIGPQGQEILTPFLLRPDDEYCFRPDRITPTPSAERRYRIDSYRQAIERAAKRAKVAHWSPNQLRHSFATKVRQVGDIESARVLLGYSKTDVSEIYAERDLARWCRGSQTNRVKFNTQLAGFAE